MLAASPARTSRISALDPHQRGVAAAVAALVLLIVVVAVAAGGGPEGAGRTDELPRQTPAELQQPLQDLHDAVNGD